MLQSPPVSLESATGTILNAGSLLLDGLGGLGRTFPLRRLVGSTLSSRLETSDGHDGCIEMANCERNEFVMSYVCV